MNSEITLYNHQQQAINKLSQLRVGGLFMDMGTGKTRTVLEIIGIKKPKSVRWFCPVSLMKTIAEEIEKHTEFTYYAFNKKTNVENIPKALIYIIGIESMSSSKRLITAANSLLDENTMIVVDESGYIKNPYTKRTINITRIAEQCYFRYILSGTPVSNGVQDLYSQLKLLSPKILGYNSFYSFAANHLEYHEKIPGMIVRAHNEELIAAKIEPYIFQIKKGECLDLPEKIYIKYECSMTGKQQKIYKETKDHIIDEAMENNKYENYSYIFDLFTQLQQIACGFSYNGENTTEIPNNRLNLLKEVYETIPKGEKLIIFTKYIYNINKIKQMFFENYNIKVAEHHGGKKEVDKFKQDTQILVANPATASHGLNLQFCKYVIFYDNSFKYSDRIQAEDRCHRIGQKNNVTYIDIICEDTIDEYIHKKLSNKEDVVKAFQKELQGKQNNAITK